MNAESVVSCFLTEEIMKDILLPRNEGEVEKIILQTLSEQAYRDWLRAHAALLADKVIVCADILQGLVPMDPVDRAWREMNGRALLYLAGIAESVERVFCGIPQRLK